MKPHILFMFCLLIVLVFFTGCGQQRNYVKPISDCFSDKDCPPGARCLNNICIQSYQKTTDENKIEKQVSFGQFYSSYELPKKEHTLVVFLKDNREKPKYRAILGSIDSELRKYKKIRIVSMEDIYSFLGIQTQKMKIDGEDGFNNQQIQKILSNYNTSVYMEVDINIFEGNIDVALKMLDFTEKKVISSQRKTYISQVNLESNIDLLVRELLLKTENQSDENSESSSKDAL
ncbi:MAG: hypothetical protein C0403_14645 [Desulfobacterium sp.]|nr:hypothetical protein [Desulfobacterium sp.]